MAEYKLQYKINLSKKQAKEKILAHAMFGNHSIHPRPNSHRRVQEYFLKRGINTDNLVEECRNPKKHIPHFENLIRSTWKANMTGGFSVSLVDDNGEAITEMKKPGLFIWSNYEAHFEAACDARDRAVAGVSYSAFQECLSQGFASIEAFFNTQSQLWNKKHPEDLLSDSKNHKVNLEDKIDQWIPKMSGGRQVDKSGRVWNDFKILKIIRDDIAIHPKLVGQGIPWDDFAKQINAFRLGIAQLLACLHYILKIPVPSVIINGIYTPDVEVVAEPDN